MPALAVRTSTRYRCEACGVTVFVIGDPQSAYRTRNEVEFLHALCGRG